MKKQKLNYRFHNPNTEKEAADFILKIFIMANAGKVDEAVRAAAGYGSADHAEGRCTQSGMHTEILLPQQTAELCR